MATSQQTFEDGIAIVLNNMNNIINGIEGRTIAGLLAGGLIIQREAQLHVPVEYGNLRASAYTRKSMSDPLAVEVGFSAHYAVYVHENMERKLSGQPRPSGLGVYWGPAGEPKFLENAATRKSDAVVNIIARYARVED